MRRRVITPGCPVVCGMAPCAWKVAGAPIIPVNADTPTILSGMRRAVETISLPLGKARHPSVPLAGASWICVMVKPPEKRCQQEPSAPSRIARNLDGILYLRQNIMHYVHIILIQKEKMPAEHRSSSAVTKRNLILAHTVKSPILTDTQRLNEEIMLALKEPAVASSGRPPFMDAIDGCFLSRASSEITYACIHNT